MNFLPCFIHASFDQLLTVWPLKSERGLLKVGILLSDSFSFQNGAGWGEVSHLSEGELRKERRGACVSVPLIPRGPEDVARGGARAA